MFQKTPIISVLKTQAKVNILATLNRLNFYFLVHCLTLLEKGEQTISTVGNQSNLVQIVITLLGSELVIITNY